MHPDSVSTTTTTDFMETQILSDEQIPDHMEKDFINAMLSARTNGSNHIEMDLCDGATIALDESDAYPLQKPDIDKVNSIRVSMWKNAELDLKLIPRGLGRNVIMAPLCPGKLVSNRALLLNQIELIQDHMGRAELIDKFVAIAKSISADSPAVPNIQTARVVIDVVQATNDEQNGMLGCFVVVDGGLLSARKLAEAWVVDQKKQHKTPSFDAFIESDLYAKILDDNKKATYSIANELALLLGANVEGIDRCGFVETEFLIREEGSQPVINIHKGHAVKVQKLGILAPLYCDGLKGNLVASDSLPNFIDDFTYTGPMEFWRQDATAGTVFGTAHCEDIVGNQWSEFHKVPESTFKTPPVGWTARRKKLIAHLPHLKPHKTVFSFYIDVSTLQKTN